MICVRRRSTDAARSFMVAFPDLQVLGHFDQAEYERQLEHGVGS